MRNHRRKNQNIENGAYLQVMFYANTNYENIVYEQIHRKRKYYNFFISD